MKRESRPSDDEILVARLVDRALRPLFPADYHGAHLAGKAVHFDIAMKEVSGPKLPDVDAEFAKTLGVAENFFEGHDIHIHIPAGGVAKDGPSAGLTIAVALVRLRGIILERERQSDWVKAILEKEV